MRVFCWVWATRCLSLIHISVAGFIYKHHKSRKTAILGAVAGAAATAVFSVPSNYFITYPAYVAVSYTHLDVYKRQGRADRQW